MSSTADGPAAVSGRSGDPPTSLLPSTPTSIRSVPSGRKYISLISSMTIGKSERMAGREAEERGLVAPRLDRDLDARGPGELGGPGPRGVDDDRSATAVHDPTPRRRRDRHRPRRRRPGSRGGTALPAGAPLRGTRPPSPTGRRSPTAARTPRSRSRRGRRRGPARRSLAASTVRVSIPIACCVATLARTASARAGGKTWRNPVRTYAQSPAPTRPAQSRKYGNDSQASRASLSRS